MAVSYDAVGPAGGGGASGLGNATLTWTHTMGAGAPNILVVWAIADPVTNGHDTTYSFAADIGGTAMTNWPTTNRKESGGDAESDGFIQSWYTLDVSSGARTINVVPTNMGVTDRIYAGSISMVGGSTLAIQNSAAFNSKTDPPTMDVTSASNHMAIAGYCDGSPDATLSSGGTSRFLVNGISTSAAGGISGSTAPGAATVTFTWVNTGDWHAAIGGDVYETGGGGSATPKKLPLIGVGP